MHKLPFLLLAGALAVPTVALAGKATTSGDQSLQLAVSLAPAKAGKKGKPRAAALKIKVDYESLGDGKQVAENTKSIALALPAGTTFHPAARPQCMLSTVLNDGPDACPAGSQVGQGTATADARPALPDPVPATVRLFNGLNDENPDGSPRDPATPSVIMFAKTSLGVNATLPFDISGSTLTTEYAPPAEGSTQLFHIQKVDITVPKGGGKPYVTTPVTCKRKWTSTMTIENFDGPSVAATHKQRCKKA